MSGRSLLRRICMAGLPGVRRAGHVPVPARPALQGQRAADQRARPVELDRGDRGHPPQQADAMPCRGGCSPSGSACSGSGDVYTYSYPKYILHHEVPFPSIGDAIYLTVYPALMVGLLLLVRRRNPQAQPQHAHRRRDPDARAVAAVVGPADRALSSRRHAGPAAQDRLGRLSARRHRSCSPPPSAWSSTAARAARPSTC